jgi:hypothetical protein
VPQEVRPVRADVNDEPVIGYRHGFEETGAGRGLDAELPDAVAVLPQPQLPGGAQHAVGCLSPELALFDLKSARKRSPHGRERILPPRLHVGCAAHDIAPLQRSVVDNADPEPVGVWVGTHLLYQADDDVTQATMEWLHAVHWRAKHGQPLGHVFDVEPAAEKVFQPAK